MLIISHKNIKALPRNDTFVSCQMCSQKPSLDRKREMRDRQKLKLICADVKSYFLSIGLVKTYSLTLTNVLWHLICILTAVNISTRVSVLCSVKKGQSEILREVQFNSWSIKNVDAQLHFEVKLNINAVLHFDGGTQNIV